MVKPTVKVDATKLTAAITKYLDYTKKDLAFLLNRKAYFIARQCARETPRADYQRMANELGIKLRKVSTGKRKGTLTMN